MNWFEQRNVVATDEAADWIGLTDRVADAFFEAYGTRYDTSKLICIYALNRQHLNRPPYATCTAMPHLGVIVLFG